MSENIRNLELMYVRITHDTPVATLEHCIYLAIDLLIYDSSLTEYECRSL